MVTRSLEYMDLMMYGLWGEGHTNDLPNPFPDYLTAEKTFVQMTQLQLEVWKKTPLAVNTQPDISNVGNRQVQDLAVRSGCWLRSDSLIMDEPIQIEELGHRPPGWPPFLKMVKIATMCSPRMRLRNKLVSASCRQHAHICGAGHEA